MQPEQAQAVEDYDDCAAFVADHAGSEINFSASAETIRTELRQAK